MQYRPVTFALGLALVGACAEPSETTLSDTSSETTSGDPLTLDYTAFVEGAVQISGLAVSRSTGQIAAVTDFERVVLISPEGQATAEFSVQLGELPEQGSCEAASFTADGDLAVLYPEAGLIRVYAPTAEGTLLSETVLPAGLSPLGGMVIDPEDDTVVLPTPGRLVAVDLRSAEIVEDVALSGLALEGEISGLSAGVDGSLAGGWIATDANRVYRVDLATGVVDAQYTLSELGDLSGVEAFESVEGERVLATSDDDDMYNAEPGPLRLYLL